MSSREESTWCVRDVLSGAVYPQPNKLIAEKVAEMHGHCEVFEKAHAPTDDERREKLARGIAREMKAPAVGRVHQHLAKAALAWVDDEQTHAPTDDEREAAWIEWKDGCMTRPPKQSFIAGWDAALRRSEAPEPQSEPTSVQLAARGSGKTHQMIDALLAQANERGIRVEVVYPQSESTSVGTRALTEFIDDLLDGDAGPDVPPFLAERILEFMEKEKR